VSGRNKSIPENAASGNESLYRDHLGIARCLARRFARAYGRSYSDLLEVAEHSLVVTLCENRYDPGRCRLSTYLWGRIQSALWSEIKRTKREIPDSDLDRLESRDSWLDSLWSEISEEARALVGILLETPEEIAEEFSPRAPVRVRRMAKQYAINHWGWSAGDANQIWEEVRSNVLTS